MTKIQLILIILAGLFLVSCMQSNYTYTPPNEIKSEEVDSKKITLTIEECEMIESVQTRNDCYKTFALREKNLDYCESIITEGDFTAIRDGKGKVQRYECFIGVSAEVLDGSLCDDLPKDVPKAQCYRNIGIKTQDSSMCMKIKDENNSIYYEECLSGISTSTLKDCETIDNFNRKNTCITNIAKTRKDINICDLEKDSPAIRRTTNEGREILNNDRDGCYIEIAKITLDKGICDKVDESKYKYCTDAIENEIEKLKPRELLTVETCNEKEGKKQEVCFFNLALQDLDESHCSKVAGDNKRCLLALGIAKDDETICNTEDCRYMRAVMSGDEQNCYALEDGYLKAYCFKFLGNPEEAKAHCFYNNRQDDWCVGEVLKDKKSPCANVGDVISGFYCQYGYAIATKNEEFCDLGKYTGMYDEDKEEDCRKYASN